MSKKKKRKRLKLPFFILIVLILTLLGYAGKRGYDIYLENLIDPTSDAYLGSLDHMITLYNMEDFTETDSVPRGLKVTLYEKVVKQTLDDKGTKKKDDDEIREYRHIKIGENEYLIDQQYLVNTYEETVPETTKYLRTSTIIYENSDDSTIKTFLKKGSAMNLIGFDTIDDTGKVNMYKIQIDEQNTGYVYEKYLVDTIEEATAQYNENGIYDANKNHKYSYDLYGGSAANLDYYPVEKVDFEDNKFVENSKTYYMNGSSKTINDVDSYINVGKTAGANAFVVDIKDGALAFPAEIAKTMSPTSYKYAMNTVDGYKAAIDKLKANGFYVIGRIVSFNDPQFAADNPSECISSTNWVSAYSRKAWEYNVKLALESVELFGFNEIQFDYVRFPEASYNYSRNGYNFKNTYNEEKSQAVQSFLRYAVDELHKKHVYVSADVFGEAANAYVTAYGQYWPAISTVVDVISAMPYPDHFSCDKNDVKKCDYGLIPPWSHPYDLMKIWGSAAAKRQTESASPAYVRTWIQAYDAIKEPYNHYGANELKLQIKGLWDSGLKGGFMTWNGQSTLSKYQELAPGFSGVY